MPEAIKQLLQPNENPYSKVAFSNSPQGSPEIHRYKSWGLWVDDEKKLNSAYLSNMEIQII